MQENIKRIDYEKVDCFKMLITPKQAYEWLLNNPQNRRIKPSRVAQLCTDIRDGKWVVNGSTIRFNKKGELIDGQHRLTAIVKTNIACESFVVTGIDQTTHIDDGASRNMADRIKIGGLAEESYLENRYCLGTATEMLRTLVRPSGMKVTFDPEEVVGWMKKHEEGFKFIETITVHKTGLQLRNAWIYSAILLAFEAGVPEQTLKDWYSIMVSGYTENGEIPSYAKTSLQFRNALISAMANKMNSATTAGTGKFNFFKDRCFKCQYCIYNYWKQTSPKSAIAKEMFFLTEPIEEKPSPIIRKRDKDEIMGDTHRHYVKVVGTKHRLFRLTNSVGVPYSVIEDMNGNEVLSCETVHEGEMLDYYISAL